MRKKDIVSFLIACCLIIQSCLPSPYYQKEHSISPGGWKKENRPDFKFYISDTTKYYSIFFSIRHTEAYPFSNIWIHIYTKKPGARDFDTSRIEVPLADPSGKWLGRNMEEIWEHRMPVTRLGDRAILNRRGLWEIKIEQNMRTDPLPEIMQVGIRVEKGKKQ